MQFNLIFLYKSSKLYVTRNSFMFLEFDYFHTTVFRFIYTTKINNHSLQLALVLT